MWLLGHTTLTYLVIKLYSIFSNRSRGKKYLGKTEARGEGIGTLLKKNSFSPTFILLLFTFAIWPDFLHVEPYRIFTHTPISIIIVPLVIIIPLHRSNALTGFEAFSIFIASIIHMLADIPFSSFYLFYPFDTGVYTFYPGFTSIGDMVTESVLASIFMIIFTYSEEHESMSRLLAGILNRNNFKRKFEQNNSTSSPLYLFIFMAFGLFSLIQILLFFRNSMIAKNAFYWHYLVFLTIFVLFAVLLGIVFLKMAFYAQKDYDDLKKNRALRS